MFDISDYEHDAQIPMGDRENSCNFSVKIDTTMRVTSNIK